MSDTKSKRRRKGSGSLFKRNGKFVYQWTCQTGKIKTKTLKATTKAAAMEEIDSIVQEEQKVALVNSKLSYLQQVAETRSLLNVCRVPLPKLEEAFFNHPSAPDITPHHRKNYHSTLEALANFAASLNIHLTCDLTEDNAGAFLTQQWKRGIAAKTYNSKLDILKRVFRTMSRDSNPFETFSKKQNTPEERCAFTVEQLQNIWTTLTSDSFQMLHKEEMKVLYKLALYTGARCGDLCLLKWESVNMSLRTIKFMPHKTAKSSRKKVEIPMSDVLYSTLAELEMTSDYVLPKVAERYQYNPGGISRDTKRLLKAAGMTPTDPGESRRLRAVSRFSFHGFRHSAASLLINNGVNPLVVRDMLGHTTVDMTARYTHVALDTKIKAVQALPVLGDNRIQNNTFAEFISNLPAEKLPRLAAFLDAYLPLSQKEELLLKLR
ncbi:MAG: site-specific integrase [Lentisphaeria bacterium]|nr:site-specific integrase [Lentisphaeria bacterium]